MTEQSGRQMFGVTIYARATILAERSLTLSLVRATIRKMAPSDDDLKNADKNAADVANILGVQDVGTSVPELWDLFWKVQRYQHARDQANFYRGRNQLDSDEGVEALAKETNAWQLFDEAFKAWRLSQTG